MENEIQNQVLEIVKPFAKNKEALANISRESSFLKDLEVNSARLVDIILAIEDTFGIEVSDEEADKIETIGLAVDLINSKKS